MVSNANERAKRAVEAMQPLGFSKKQTIRVLKELLKVYTNKWELIEDDNYRVLADAILDSQENVNDGIAENQESPHTARPTRAHTQEDQGQSQSQPQSTPVSNSHAWSTPVSNSGACAPGPSSSKRHRLDSASGASSAQNDDMDQEEAETETGADLLIRKRPRRISTSEIISPEPQIDDRAIVLAPPQPISPSDPAHKDGRTSIDPQSGTIITYQRASVSKRRSNGITLREPKLEPGLEAEFENVENGDRPLAVIYPGSGSQGNQERETPVTVQTDTPSQPVNPNSNYSCETESVPDRTGTELHMSCSSDRKINLLFRFPNRNPNLPVPNLDDFLKLVEDRCLKSFKILKPDFSLPNFLNEMCQIMSEQLHTNTEMETGTESPTVPVNPTENGTGTETEMVPVPTPRLDLGEIRPAHNTTDICKGLERLAIQITNQYNAATCPPHFTYMSQNHPYQHAYLCFTLARIGDENCCTDCFGNCVSAPVPCACARESNGEFRYTNEGILRADFLDECVGLSWDRDLRERSRVFCEGLGFCPFEAEGKCKGHVERKFVKECWTKCGCDTQCANRVVQRGIMCRLQVFMTPDGRGWGLQTLDEIPKGTFVCEFVGEVLTRSELHKRLEQNKNYGKNMNVVELDASCQASPPGQEGLYLDSTFYGNVARFVNHRCCDANLVEIPVEIESPDHHYYHLALFTTRKIEAFEELTWDYGIDFSENENFGNGLHCKCGSKYCRNSQRSRGKRGRKQ